MRDFVQQIFVIYDVQLKFGESVVAMSYEFLLQG